MKKLRLSISFLALVAVTFLLLSPRVFGIDLDYSDIPEYGQPPEPPYDQGVDRTKSKREHWRGGYNKDEIFEAASKLFNVDKKVIEETEKFEKENHMCEDICSKDTIKLVILARYRTDNLQEEGKLSREEDRKVMNESVVYIRERRKKQYVASELAAGRKTKAPDKEKGGWGDLIKEAGITPKDLWFIGKMLYNCLNCFYVDEPTIKGLEKQGLSHEDALKIYLLAKFSSDRIIGSGQFSKMQEAESLREATRYFVYQYVEKQEPWEKLARQVEITARDLNLMAGVIQGAEKRPFNMPDPNVPGVEAPPPISR